MPAENALSNPRPLRKGKGCANAPLEPKKKPGCKRGAVMWTSSKYVRLYCKILVIRPTGNNQWELVSTEHSAEGTTKRSLELCKMRWYPVLKLKKPTGGAKMHPLHCLALAINAEICKLTGTYMMNNEANNNPYGDLAIEFQRAKDNMHWYKMDPNCPPKFDVPMPDKDAQGDKLDPPPEELSKDKSDGGDKDDTCPSAGEVTGDNRDKMEPDPQAFCRSPFWDLEAALGLSTPAPATSPARPPPNIQQQALTSVLKSSNTISPFPMSKLLPAKSLFSPKAVKPKPHAPADPPQRKQPNPKPKGQPTPEPGNASAGLLTKDANKSNKSNKPNKRKAVNKEAWGVGQALPQKKLATLLSKNLQSKPNEGEVEVINLISDDEDPFITNYMARKLEDNMATVAFMDHKRKIQRLKSQLETANARIRKLEIQLETANARIRELEIQFIKLEQDAKVQQLVAAEVAKIKLEHQRQHTHHHANPFDSAHPFDNPPPDNNMMFNMQHMH
ncbi:hypothetical protein RHS04_07905 [Rhizoctonia solani]|uniref:Uncharacterized protein n=1 Tax=Rhizoctonia solani TaxID=456999 RepID=A0A8H7H4W2_9AGAM|nr:hypothetical protein RHS04_07905 [Rhizoctonia solani]